MIKNKAFEGFETFFNAFKMALKMHGYILIFLLIAHLIILFKILDLKSYETKLLLNWFKIHAIIKIDQQVKFPLPGGGSIVLPANQIKQKKEIRNYVNIVFLNYLATLKKTSLIYLAYPLLLFFFSRRATTQTANRHLRGSQMISPAEYRWRALKNLEKTSIPFGPVKMPLVRETQHTILVGKSGCGKTTVVNKILEKLRKRNERAIIYDSKGDFIPRFYDPSRDMIWNPVDDRCLKWTIFNDFSKRTDIYAFAHSQIPQEHGRNAFWSDTARDLFIAILGYLYGNDKRTNADIWQMTIADDAVIGSLLQDDGHLAAKYLSNPDSDTAKSIISSMIRYLQSYEFMADVDGDFSIGSWVENGEGFIFISSFSDIRDSLRPVISIFIDTLAKKLLATTDSPNRKTFFILEELWTLQRLPTLLDLITQSRSKGGALFLSVQEIAQLDTIYGRDNRKTLFNNCSNKLIMASAEPETAEYMSTLIGDQEIIESGRTYNLGVDNFKDGINLSQNVKMRRVVLPSEIKLLNNLHGILQIGGYPPFPITFKYKKFEDKYPAIILRKSNYLPSDSNNDVNIQITKQG